MRKRSHEGAQILSVVGFRAVPPDADIKNMTATIANRVAALPHRAIDRLRWEWREWRRPSRPTFLQEELDRALLDEIAWSTGERVLDIGCARGEYLRSLTRRGVAMHGLDIDNKLIRHAHLTGCPVVGASGDCLPFADGSFDAIVCHKTMYLFESPPVALREFHRVLRSGGRVAFSTSRVRTPYALAQALAIRMSRDRNWAFNNRLGPGAWIDLAKSNGFEVDTVYSCNLVTPLVFRVCDRWLIPNEWMRRYARTVRRLLNAPLASHRPHALAQDFVIVIRKN